MRRFVTTREKERELQRELQRELRRELQSKHLAAQQSNLNKLNSAIETHASRIPVDTGATRKRAMFANTKKFFGLSAPVDAVAKKPPPVLKRLGDALRLTRDLVARAPVNTGAEFDKAERKFSGVFDSLGADHLGRTDNSQSFEDMLHKLNLNTNPTNTTNSKRLAISMKSRQPIKNQELKELITNAVSEMEKGKQKYFQSNQKTIDDINTKIRNLELSGILSESDRGLFKSWKSIFPTFDIRDNTMNSSILVDYILYRYDNLIDIYTFITDFMVLLKKSNYGEALSIEGKKKSIIKKMKEDNDPRKYIVYKSDHSKYIATNISLLDQPKYITNISLNILNQQNMMLDITQTFTKLFTTTGINNKLYLDNFEYLKGLATSMDNFEYLKGLATEIEELLKISHDKMKRYMGGFDTELKKLSIDEPAEELHNSLLPILVTEIKEFIDIICKFFKFIDDIADKLFSNKGNHVSVYKSIEGLRTAISNIVALSRENINEIKKALKLSTDSITGDKIESKFVNKYLENYPKERKLTPDLVLPRPPLGGRRKSPKKTTKLNRGADMNMKDIRGLCKVNQIKLSKTKDGVRVIYTKKELITKLKRKKIL